MRNISILGSTGSIGKSTLAVVDAFPDQLTVVGLAAGANVELLAEQVEPLGGPRGDILENDLEVRLAERLPAFERAEIAVAADDWRQAELEVHVGRTRVDSGFQQRVEVHGRAEVTIGSLLRLL